MRGYFGDRPIRPRVYCHHRPISRLTVAVESCFASSSRGTIHRFWSLRPRRSPALAC